MTPLIFFAKIRNTVTLMEGVQLKIIPKVSVQWSTLTISIKYINITVYITNHKLIK